jgi:hypothetical protein
VSGILPAFRLGSSHSSWRVSEANLMAFIHRHGHHDPADVAESADPNQLPTPAPSPALLTTRRNAEGLKLVELQRRLTDPNWDA